MAGGMLGACPRSHFTIVPIFSCLSCGFLQGGLSDAGWLALQQPRQLAMLAANAPGPGTARPAL